MARRRFGTRRRMNRGPSAFAPSRLPGGRALSWEALGAGAAVAPMTTNLPNLAYTTAAIQTRYVTLIPINVTRGVVTLERVRGSIWTWLGEVETTADLANWATLMTVQLVPVRNGAIIDDSVLSARNTADLENNRIIWQRAFYPMGGATITGPGPLEYYDMRGNGDVDIKSRRRFDRALWALILTADIDISIAGVNQSAFRLRGLFRAPDGL